MKTPLSTSDRRITRTIIVAAALIMAGGCSTIIEGTSQDISISSTPSGARCDLEREGAVIANVKATPAVVTVRKSKYKILAKCDKAGYEQASQYLDSGVATGTFGNIIAGGVIGWGVDSATGADNRYPDAVNVMMVKIEAQHP
jgi:hypothetical protein